MMAAFYLFLALEL